MAMDGHACQSPRLAVWLNDSGCMPATKAVTTVYVSSSSYVATSHACHKASHNPLHARTRIRMRAPARHACTKQENEWIALASGRLRAPTGLGFRR
jgi:hypothetical protein